MFLTENHKSGYTLAELVIVVVIIGILAGVGVPGYRTTVESMKAAEGAQVLTVLLGAQKRYEIENGSYATDINTLDVSVSPTNFISPQVFDNASKVASLLRGVDQYTLQISDAGVITCVDGAAPDFTCAQVGY